MENDKIDIHPQNICNACSSFFFSEKKELFGLVASPFFLFIEKSFHVTKTFQDRQQASQ